MVYNAIAVFFGGAFGALFRFLITQTFTVSKWGIPFTIIIINFSGCFIMGVLDAFFESFNYDTKVKSFLTIGLLGGFTTFSSFSLEFAELMRKNAYFESFLYISISLFTALAGFFIGYIFFKLLKFKLFLPGK